MKKLVAIICMLGLIAGASYSFAEQTNRTASIMDVSGTVDVKIASADWAPAKKGMILNMGDTIRTKAGSWAVVNLDGNGETASVEVKEKSQMRLAELYEDKQAATESTLLDLALGQVMVKAKKLHSDKSRFEVKTPTSIVGVRGTTFSVSVESAE